MEADRKNVLYTKSYTEEELELEKNDLVFPLMVSPTCATKFHEMGP